MSAKSIFHLGLRWMGFTLILLLGMSSIGCFSSGGSDPQQKEDSNNWDEMVWDKDTWSQFGENVRSIIMNTLCRLITTMLSIALTMSLAVAGEVTIPNTFTSGTTAKAAEVNDNFSAVKTEVNDNNLRIDAIETQTQNIETGCPAGEAIAKIATNGTITCEADTDTVYSAGTGLNLTGTQFTVEAGNVSISAQAFASKILSPVNVQYCVLIKGEMTSYAYFNATSGAANAGCDALAGVQLPDNVMLTGLHCRVLDNNDSNYIQAALWRTNLITDDPPQSIYTTDQSVDNAQSQVVSGTTANDPLFTKVDNGQYAYYVSMNYSTNNFETLGGNGIFYGCRISYTP